MSAYPFCPDCGGYHPMDSDCRLLRRNFLKSLLALPFIGCHSGEKKKKEPEFYAYTIPGVRKIPDKTIIGKTFYIDFSAAEEGLRKRMELMLLNDNMPDSVRRICEEKLSTKTV